MSNPKQETIEALAAHIREQYLELKALRAKCEALSAVAEHAKHLLDGGGDEAAHHLTKALEKL